MILKNLGLLHFKNYEALEMVFCDGINCFAGPNGSGKTNLLDAIHFLCLTKSAFISGDSFLIQHGAPFYMVKGNFDGSDEQFKVHMSYKLRQKKVVKCNDYQYERLTEHVGKFPVVLIAPDDTDLIREGSEVRRRFFDNVLSQFDRGYLEALVQYNHVLKQRNSLMKQFSESGKVDDALLEPFNLQLATYGKKIRQSRVQLLAEFVDLFQQCYREISAEREEVSLDYASQLSEVDFDEGLRLNLRKDLQLQRSTFGIHRDDFVFKIAARPLKKFGSQGQQKSFVIALQLAKFAVLEKHLEKKPLLLLDDIFDKLDENRMANLLRMVNQKRFGQVFLTDASLPRCEAKMKEVQGEIRIFEIEQGQLLKEVSVS